MPQVGETKTIGGVTGQWDGQTWRQVSGGSAAPSGRGSSLLDLVPGLSDVLHLPSNLIAGAKAVPDVVRGLVNNPGATIKGGIQGVSEAATPGRLGLLALLTGGATLPAALAAAGGEAAAQGGMVATGSPQAPTSFGDAALKTGEAAAPALIGAGINKGVSAARAALPNLTSTGISGVGGGVLGGYEGYKRGGIPGALEGAAIGAVAGKKLPGWLGTGGGDAAAGDAASSEAGGFAGQPKATYINRPSAPFSGADRAEDFWPQGQTVSPSTPGPMSPRLAGSKAPGLNNTLDDILNGLKGDEGAAPAVSIGTGPKPQPPTPAAAGYDTPGGKFNDIFGPEGPSKGFDWPEAGGRFEPDASGSHVSTPSTQGGPGTVWNPEANQANIDRSTPFGEGGMRRESLPSELRSSALDGLNAPQTGSPVNVDMDYSGKPMVTSGSLDVLDGGPESGRFPTPTREGQDIPSSQDVDSLISSIPETPAARGVATSVPSSGATAASAQMPSSLQAIEKMFGPGTADMSGQPFQSTSGYKGANNLLYDPQTPTDYLRQQYLDSTEDPATQDFLGRALRQRLRLGQSSQFQMPDSIAK